MIINRKPDPSVGDIKTKRKFLLIPAITNEKIAWFGFHTLTYMYIGDYHGTYPLFYWTLIGVE